MSDEINDREEKRDDSEETKCTLEDVAVCSKLAEKKSDKERNDRYDEELVIFEVLIKLLKMFHSIK